MKRCVTCKEHKGLTLYWDQCEECWNKSLKQIEKENEELNPDGEVFL